MRNLQELNINEGGEPVKKPPPTEQDFTRLAKLLDFEVPLALKKLLLFSNGGHPELDSLYVPKMNEWFSINRFYSISSSEEENNSISGVYLQWKNYTGQDKLPFAEDGGGNQFVLNLRSAENPVFLCLHDENFRLVKISDSFEDFIDDLEGNPEFI